MNNCVNVSNYKHFVLVLMHSAVGIFLMKVAEIYAGHTVAVFAGTPAKMYALMSGARESPALFDPENG